jgi:3-phosphoshikimate 1-carboxyvinyltransferase
LAPTADEPILATVRLPGSKSMTARALVLSAISSGSSTVRHPLKARDTELMAAGLRAMGVQISSVEDEQWLVRPRPLRGPAHVEVGIAGTVMRFVPSVAGLAEGTVTFDGDTRARERPMAALLAALADAGVRLSTEREGFLPLTIYGNGRVRGGEVVIDASESSQLISGLLLGAAAYDRGMVVRHVGPPVPSAPHIRMTVEMVRSAGGTVDDTVPDIWRVEPGRLVGRAWSIEPDLSGAAPFLAAAMVTGGSVTVPDWPRTTTQAGDRLRELLAAMGARVSAGPAGLTVQGTGVVHGLDVDLSEVSELSPVIAALATVGDRPSRLSGIGHTRGHETDRVTALARELSKLGAEIVESQDGLEIRPRPMRGAFFETYADHRLAHAAAVIGLVVPGVELSDVACTSKTMPAFPRLWAEMTETQRTETQPVETRRTDAQPTEMKR